MGRSARPRGDRHLMYTGLSAAAAKSTSHFLVFFFLSTVASCGNAQRTTHNAPAPRNAPRRCSDPRSARHVRPGPSTRSAALLASQHPAPQTHHYSRAREPGSDTTTHLIAGYAPTSPPHDQSAGAEASAPRRTNPGARAFSLSSVSLSLSFSLSLSRPLSSSSSSSSSPLLSSLLPPSSRSSMRLLPRSHDRYTAIKWPVAPDHNPQRTGWPCMAQHSRAHATQSRPASHHHRGPDISPKNSATHLTQEELARSVRTLDHQNYADAGRAQPNQNPARPEPSSAPTPRRWWPQRPPGRHPKTRQATQPQGK